MDREQSWRLIERERLRLAALLETLSQDEWNQPSLCAGWRVRDVAAHVALTPQPPSVLGMLAEGVRAGGRFHKLNHDVAVRHAARPGVDVVAELREHAASRRLPAVTSYRNILFDVLVHSQDIALPLGRQHPMPIDAARAGAQRVWTMGWPFWARHRLRHYCLTATDITWSVAAPTSMDRSRPCCSSSQVAPHHCSGSPVPESPCSDVTSRRAHHPRADHPSPDLHPLGVMPTPTRPTCANEKHTKGGGRGRPPDRRPLGLPRPVRRGAPRKRSTSISPCKGRLVRSVDGRVDGRGAPDVPGTVIMGP